MIQLLSATIATLWVAGGQLLYWAVIREKHKAGFWPWLVCMLAWFIIVWWVMLTGRDKL